MEIERSGKKDFSRIGFAYFALFIISYLLQLASLGLVKEYWPYWMQFLLSMLPMYLVAAPACYLIMKKVPVSADEKKEHWGIGKMLLVLMISIGVMYLGNIVSQILMGIVNMVRGNPSVNPIETIILNSNILINILVIVILAPIVEELLFRKLLIDRIGVYGQGTAVVVSGILFGLFHGNFYQLIYAFLLGVIFAYVYVKTRRIVYCIGLHMTINFMGSVLAPLLLEGVNMDALSVDPAEIMEMLPRLIPLLGYAFFMIACMIASIVVIISFRNRITFEAGTVVIPKGRRFTTIFMNVGMILFVLGCISMFIMNLL